MSIDKKQLSKLVYFFTTFDGGVYKNGNGCYYVMNMREENRDYIEWVSSTLQNITSTKITARKDYNTDGYNRKPQLRIESSQHPYFKRVRERVYLGNHKVIDPHLLALLDWEALAIIFMADGGTSLDKRWTNPHCKVSLNTKGFSYSDNMALSKAIYEKCNIRTSINRQNNYYYLVVKTADILKFVEGITPYLKKSFFYKLERIAPALSYMQGGDIV